MKIFIENDGDDDENEIICEEMNNKLKEYYTNTNSKERFKILLGKWCKKNLW